MYKQKSIKQSKSQSQSKNRSKTAYLVSQPIVHLQKHTPSPNSNSKPKPNFLDMKTDTDESNIASVAGSLNGGEEGQPMLSDLMFSDDSSDDGRDGREGHDQIIPRSSPSPSGNPEYKYNYIENEGDNTNIVSLVSV